MKTPDIIYLTDELDQEGIEITWCDEQQGIDDTKYIKESIVLKGINDEPEYTGEMSDNLWDSLKTAILTEDKDLVMYAFRQAVKDTKQGIIERLEL